MSSNDVRRLPVLYAWRDSDRFDDAASMSALQISLPLDQVRI